MPTDGQPDRRLPFGRTGYFVAGTITFLVYSLIVLAGIYYVAWWSEDRGELIFALGLLLLGMVGTIGCGILAVCSLKGKLGDKAADIFQRAENPGQYRPLYSVLGIAALVVFLLMVILLSLANR